MIKQEAHAAEGEGARPPAQACAAARVEEVWLISDDEDSECAGTDHGDSMQHSEEQSDDGDESGAEAEAHQQQRGQGAGGWEGGWAAGPAPLPDQRTWEAFPSLAWSRGKEPLCSKGLVVGAKHTSSQLGSSAARVCMVAAACRPLLLPSQTHTCTPRKTQHDHTHLQLLNLHPPRPPPTHTHTTTTTTSLLPAAQGDWCTLVGPGPCTLPVWRHRTAACGDFQHAGARGPSARRCAGVACRARHKRCLVGFHRAMLPRSGVRAGRAAAGGGTGSAERTAPSGAGAQPHPSARQAAPRRQQEATRGGERHTPRERCKARERLRRLGVRRRRLVGCPLAGTLCMLRRPQTRSASPACPGRSTAG
jgi:hypothetical protein